MLYFAYGSNLSWDQMQKRCPSTRFLGKAVLPDYKLAFTRKSVNRGSGVADAIPQRGERLWGVVFELDDLDLGRLDASEGYNPGRQKNSYFRGERRVLLDGDARQPLTVMVYFAYPQPNPPRPNRAYKDLIIEGAKHWRLPADYIQKLEQIETVG